VRVGRGPFAGVCGRLEEVEEGYVRVRLLSEGVSRSVKLRSSALDGA
jgi:transcription antitermination factor NusG